MLSTLINNDLNRKLNKQQQTGAVLIVSLIMLLLLTILGVTALKNTTIEEKMASNARDRDLAFHAAESALREAEVLIRNMINVASFASKSSGKGSVDGYYSRYNPTHKTPDINAILKDPATWTDDSKSIEISGINKIDGVVAQPRFIIQHIQHVEPPGNISFGGYGTNRAGSEIDYFKIYARGVGATATSQVILETAYGMRF